MPPEYSLFLVERNKKSKLLRLILTLFPGVLLSSLLGEHLSYFTDIALFTVAPCLLGWFLVFRPAHYLEVHEDRLVHKNMLNNKEKSIAFAEIRGAYYRGFSLFRYLILSTTPKSPWFA